MDTESQKPYIDETSNPDVLVGWFQEVKRVLGEGFEFQYGLLEKDLTLDKCQEYDRIIERTLASDESKDLSEDVFNKVIRYMKLRNKVREILGEAFTAMPQEKTEEEND